jgi:hypothetical protein
MGQMPIAQAEAEADDDDREFIEADDVDAEGEYAD